MAEVTFNYHPFPIHQPFHQTRAREKAAIGAVGSGKTIALCADAILLGWQQPGSRILIARQTVPSLRDTTEHEFLQLISSLPDGEEHANATTLYDTCEIRKSGGHVDRIIFPNGSEFLFRSLDDWRKLMSLNLAAFYVDEASEITVESYLGLLTRLRQREPTQKAQRLGYKTITKQQAAICMNPNGHDWAWEYFVHAPSQNRDLVTSRRYFRSTSFDNPTLYDENGEPNEYLRHLLSMPEVWVRRYVLCSFDAFEGQIYEFSPEYHVHAHFDPPSSWERAMGFDWGLRNPAAATWWARDPKTLKWHQYREWQSYDQMDVAARESRVTPTVHEVASMLKALEKGEKITWRVIDPSAHKREADSGKSVHWWLRRYGFHFQNGIQDFGSRINSLNTMFHQRQLSISSSCTMTAIATQQYRWSDVSPTRTTDGPERPHKFNDHLVNANEYIATMFNRPRPIPEVKDIPSFDEEVWAKVKRQVRRPNRQKWSYGVL